MAKDAVTARMERQHSGLRALREKAWQDQQQEQEAGQYLLALRNRCLDMAYLIFMDVKDAQERPYIQQILNTAEKSSTVFGLGVVALSHVLVNGKAFGINAEILVRDYYIPHELVSVAEALVPREAEPQEQRRSRIAHHYAALKAEIISSVEKANLACIPNPTMKDLDTCSNFLSNALSYKTHPAYRENQNFDFIIDLIDLSKLRNMIYADEYTCDNDEMISMCLYFGYECYPDRRFTVRYVARIHTDKTVKMEITTFTNANEFSNHCLYRNRKMTITFPCVQAVYSYLEETQTRLAQCPSMERRRQHQTLSHVTLGLLTKEKFIMEEIDRKFC